MILQSQKLVERVLYPHFSVGEIEVWSNLPTEQVCESVRLNPWVSHSWEPLLGFWVITDLHNREGPSQNISHRIPCLCHSGPSVGSCHMDATQSCRRPTSLQGQMVFSLAEKHRNGWFSVGGRIPRSRAHTGEFRARTNNTVPQDTWGELDGQGKVGGGRAPWQQAGAAQHREMAILTFHFDLTVAPKPSLHLGLI